MIEQKEYNLENLSKAEIFDIWFNGITITNSFSS